MHILALHRMYCNWIHGHHYNLLSLPYLFAYAYHVYTAYTEHQQCVPRRMCVVQIVPPPPPLLAFGGGLLWSRSPPPLPLLMVGPMVRICGICCHTTLVYRLHSIIFDDRIFGTPIRAETECSRYETRHYGRPYVVHPLLFHICQVKLADWID